MSESPTPAPSPDQRQVPDDGTGVDEVESSSFLVRLAYALYGAVSADFGCLIGAIVFVLLIYLSYQFAPILTPCTSAGGIPCAH